MKMTLAAACGTLVAAVLCGALFVVGQGVAQPPGASRAPDKTRGVSAPPRRAVPPVRAPSVDASRVTLEIMLDSPVEIVAERAAEPLGPTAGVIAVNDDDDDRDGQADREQYDPVEQADDDLAPLRLSWQGGDQSLAGCKLRYFVRASSVARLWLNPWRDPLPPEFVIGGSDPETAARDTLYVEGKKTGTTRIGLTLFDPAGEFVVEDEVDSAVVPLEATRPAVRPAGEAARAAPVREHPSEPPSEPDPLLGVAGDPAFRAWLRKVEEGEIGGDVDEMSRPLRDRFDAARPREFVQQLLHLAVYGTNLPAQGPTRGTMAAQAAGLALIGLDVPEREIVETVLPHLGKPQTEAQAMALLEASIDGRDTALRSGQAGQRLFAPSRRRRADLYAEYVRRPDAPLALIRHVFAAPAEADASVRMFAWQHVREQVLRPGLADRQGSAFAARFIWAASALRTHGDALLAEAPPEQLEPLRLAAGEYWEFLARHEEWWARAYAASFLQTAPGPPTAFVSRDMAEALQKDADPRVRAVASLAAHNGWAAKE